MLPIGAMMAVCQTRSGWQTGHLPRAAYDPAQAGV